MSFLECITVNSKVFYGKFEVNYRKIAIKIAKIRFLCLYINIHEEKGLETSQRFLNNNRKWQIIQVSLPEASKFGSWKRENEQKHEIVGWEKLFKGWKVDGTGCRIQMCVFDEFLVEKKASRIFTFWFGTKS